MIEVENLTKRYGSFEAIRGVSFRVAKGEVVGFLGPNGAGKTTTMRILCGCIGATSGRALVDGKDVLEDPREVKRKIGYLPEIPPLYASMVVRDYVAFAARIKGVDDPEGAARAAMGKVGLDQVAHRLIDHLSKGYRQRVGLAQALVHDPEVLVLDEPTSGLDPAQRVEIRDLLKSLAAGDRTVILSTHVLSEVEAVCDRVVIVNQGSVVAQDTIEALASSGRRIRLKVEPTGARARAASPGARGGPDRRAARGRRLRARCRRGRPRARGGGSGRVRAPGAADGSWPRRGLPATRSRRGGMKATLAIARRELDAYFATPVGWLCLFGFVSITGLFFALMISQYSYQSTQAAMSPYMAGELTLSEYLVAPFFGNVAVILLLLCPALSMRLFAEDRRQRAFELLLAAPVSTAEIVLGKYLGALAFLVVLLFGTIHYVGLLYWVGSPDAGVLAASYAGTFLLAAAFMAVGMLASSFTENQVVALVTSFGLLLALWIVSWGESFAGEKLGAFIGYLSVMHHMEEMSKGLLHLEDVVYYLTFIGFFVFATHQRVDAYRWQ